MFSVAFNFFILTLCQELYERVMTPKQCRRQAIVTEYRHTAATKLQATALPG